MRPPSIFCCQFAYSHTPADGGTLVKNREKIKKTKRGSPSAGWRTTNPLKLVGKNQDVVTETKQGILPPCSALRIQDKVVFGSEYDFPFPFLDHANFLQLISGFTADSDCPFRFALGQKDVVSATPVEGGHAIFE